VSAGAAGAPGLPEDAEANATPATAELAIIAAVAANGVIGREGGLPWRLPPDLRHFRALTTGHAVIMGRRTWDSLGRALSDRQNIVVTARPERAASGAECAFSLPDAIARVRRPAPAFCIGGARLYREALSLATRMHLTEIDREFDGDTTFPPFDRGAWREVAREAHVHDGLRFAFVTYRRAR
jgi:dihydrofolate reductase